MADSWRMRGSGHGHRRRSLEPAAHESSKRLLENSVPVEFRTVLRLRPFHKKERDDPLVLKIPSSRLGHQQQSSSNAKSCHPQPSSTQQSTTSTTTAFVSMRANPKFDHKSHNNNKHNNNHHSSSFAPFASPSNDYNNNKTAANHDTEFHFDQVFGPDATQDLHMFGHVGRSMSLAAMEPLFSSSAKRVTHVNIAVGTTGSGKSFTCWGSGNPSSHNNDSSSSSSVSSSCSSSSSSQPNLKKKQPSDGIIPRMTDSLFGQYQRLSSIANNKKKNATSCNTTFAIQLSAYQVNQPKQPKTPSGDAGKLYDLLQYTSSERQQRRNSSRLSPKPAAAASTANRRSSFEPKTSNTRGGGEGKNESIYIDQNPLTHDFCVKNAQSRYCRSSEDARETLQNILFGIRKASHRRQQCHVLVQMQPLLLDSQTHKVVKRGGTLVFLDMAGSEDWTGAGNKASRHRLLSKRLKDSFPSRCDAHASVTHCLRSILFNELLRQGQHPSSSSPKQVPYLQHKITMLLQPYFMSRNNSNQKTIVTMLVTASPGHRDYVEKRYLLAEIESLWQPFHRACVIVTTGLEQDDESGDDNDSVEFKALSKVRSGGFQHSNNNKRRHRLGYQRDDEASGSPSSSSASHPRRAKDDTELPIAGYRRNNKHCPPDRSIQRSYSDSTDDFSMPPPMAPPAPSLKLAQDVSRHASAPIEDEFYRDDTMKQQLHFKEHSREQTPPPALILSDFPGVVLERDAYKSGKPPPPPQTEFGRAGRNCRVVLDNQPPLQHQHHGHHHVFDNAGISPSSSSSLSSIQEPSRSPPPPRKYASRQPPQRERTPTKPQHQHPPVNKNKLKMHSRHPTGRREPRTTKERSESHSHHNPRKFDTSRSPVRDHPHKKSSKSWSKTVEVTTTRVERSNPEQSFGPSVDSISSVSQVETMESELSDLKDENNDLKGEMHSLKQQNELLQEQLQKLQQSNKTSRNSKSVSWGDNDAHVEPSSSDRDDRVDEAYHQRSIRSRTDAMKHRNIHPSSSFRNSQLSNSNHQSRNKSVSSYMDNHGREPSAEQYRYDSFEDISPPPPSRSNGRSHIDNHHGREPSVEQYRYDSFEDISPQPPSRTNGRSHKSKRPAENAAPTNTTTSITTRLMNSPLLREQLAKLGTESSNTRSRTNSKSPPRPGGYPIHTSARNEMGGSRNHRHSPSPPPPSSYGRSISRHGHGRQWYD